MRRAGGLGLVAAGLLAGAGPRPAGAGEEPDCALFTNEERWPVVHLDAAAIDSIGQSLSARNVELIDRIDAAYREGRYGPPGSEEARRNALDAFIYSASVAFDFVLEIALQHEVIYSTSEEDLREAFTVKFRNPGIYPIMNLVDARAGFGRFCMKFEVESDGKREIVVGGERMRAWTEDLEIDDVRRRVVNIDMKTFSHDRVNVVYERYSSGDVRVFETEVHGWPVQVFTMENLQGQYIRKFGLHKPSAVILWKSPPRGIDPPPPEGRFLGSAVYIPRLRLDLPWFLPSIGFQDLRKFEFPEPVLSLEATRDIRRRDLDWLHLRENLRFADWEGEGEIPPFVTERFPDY